MVPELARRMDEQYPGWADPIDLSTLNMNDNTCCVIGQGVTHGVGAAYYGAVQTLERDGIPISQYFLRPYDAEWRTEIEARRN